ncbi:MAG: hypothetical protein V9G23_06975 [Giesbergeria sp.]
MTNSKEVLIFKVAVALGFDAPRAFTLVSMRGAKDTDFRHSGGGPHPARA